MNKRRVSSPPVARGGECRRRSKWLLLLATLLLLGTSLDARADDQADYERALARIEESLYNRVFTEVNGQKYYVDANGFLTDNKANAPIFKFNKVAGWAYAHGFMLQNGNNDTYFTYPNGTDEADLAPGHLNKSGWGSHVSNAQVFFLNEDGRYAIRSSNDSYEEEDENLWVSTYWAIKLDGEGNVSVGYSFEKNYIWQLEEDYRNDYPAGTTFPKFQFKLENMTGVTVVDDDVTVTYTHANGTTWTEHYPFSSLKAHQSDDAGVMLYDLPFSFTEEHPDANKDQIGEALVTAEIAMNIRNGSGQTEAVCATASLVPQWKEMALGNYYEADTYYIDGYYSSADARNVPVTFTGEVMYLPRDSHYIGYILYATDEEGNKFPFLVKSHTTDSETIPDWLELEESPDSLYVTAKVTASFIMPEMYGLNEYWANDKDIDITFCLRANRVPISYGEGIVEFEAAKSTCKWINMYDHASLYRNDEESLLHHNESAPEEIVIGTYDINGWHGDDIDLLNGMDFYTVHDDLMGGADVTLSIEGSVIQKLTKFTGTFSFMPPPDGRKYELDINFPGYGKRYIRNYTNPAYENVYRIKTHSDYKDPYSEWNYTISYTKNGEEYSYWTPYQEQTAYMTTDEPVDFIVSKHIFQDGFNNEIVGRISLPDLFTPIKYDIKPELKVIGQLEYGETFWGNREEHANYVRSFYPQEWTSCGPMLTLNWEEIARNTTIVTVVDEQGNPVTNATLHTANVDNKMTLQGGCGTARYSSSQGGYIINTDSRQYGELIEVVAPGYQPMLATMYTWNYDYFSRENRNKTRRHTIVLHRNDTQLGSASLETLKRFGNVKDGQMNAKLANTDLLAMSSDETLIYSQNGDYETVTKTVDDQKFGDEGWTGTKYARLCGSVAYGNDEGFDPEALSLTVGGTALAPASTKLLTKSVFTTFSQNYCLFEFDLVDQIEDDATVKPVVKNGSTTLAELPSLNNNSVDLIALSEESNIELPGNLVDLTKVDDSVAGKGIDMKDMSKAFDKFNFQTPPVLPFTVNIEREGDYFLVRAVCEVNFLPSGTVMNVLDKLDNLNYFDEQYKACMNAVNTAKPANDDFFEDIPVFPSAFVGLKGFLSGVGHYNPETKKIDINFYDGGLTMEASAKASARVSFGIGGFGVSVDAKIASTMALVNHAAALGDVGGLPKIDFVLDNQARLKVCAWAEAGLDIWIAKAVVGVRGGASIDMQTRVVLPTYNDNAYTGAKFSVRAAMEAYAEARFLCFKKKKKWKIFDAQENWLAPNDATNPLHPGFGQQLFSYSSQNVTKSYKRLPRRVISDLGSPIIENVSGMARPTYLLGGESVLFNNLKSASDYNDDRLQVYNGSSSDLVNTGVNAPMYDFAVAHNSAGTEVVAFEQVKTPIDANTLEAMVEETQTKTLSENTGIRVAMRQNGGSWTTQELGDPYWNNASVTPVAAVQQDGKAAVVWQQGVVKYSSDDDRYIDGSLMLSRYDGSTWSDPIEIKRLNSRSVPTDYQMSMKEDSVLVMMTLKQDVNNPAKQPSVVYVSVTPNDQVRERYTQAEGNKPQMVHINGVNLIGFLQQTEDGRDISLSTVNMRGVPTGKLSGRLNMEKRMVNDFRLVVDDEATDLDDVALLWNQNDQEGTTDENGVTTFVIKNRIYTSKLCSHDKELFFSAPVEIATMPDDVSLVSMDGYLDGLDMKVAYCVANDDEGAAVMETSVAYTNAFDYKVDYNPYEVTDEKNVPVTITMANNGYTPISQVTVEMDDNTYTYEMKMMPRESKQLTVNYPVTDDFNGTINYSVTAQYLQPNSNSLKLRRRAASRPLRIKRSGTEGNIRQVDMAAKILNKSVDANNVTTIVAEVNNASLLPLSEGMTCKVGLYASPLSTEPVGEAVTVDYADLYDATNKVNKTKIVTLTAEQPSVDCTLYLRTTPMEDDEVVNDVRPSNNVLPVSLVGRNMPGDVNRDGLVNIADVTALVNIILGKDNSNYNHVAADMNKDNKINVTDVTALVNNILGKDSSQDVELLTNGECDGTFNGWEVTNGGSGWIVDPATGGDYADGHPWWASSYSVCTLSQTVTLSDHNISTEKVDNGNVTCTASADVLACHESNGKGSTVCEVTVQMLDANNNVLATETVMNDTSVFSVWTTFSKSFKLKSGTRQLKFVVRGQDAVYWGGQFGPCFRKLSMKVKK